MSVQERYIVLTEGNTHPTPAKLASALLRYRPETVCALIDSEQAGRDASGPMNCAAGVPIVASLKDGLIYRPDTLVLGTTPPGGVLPNAWRIIVLDAIRHGLNIMSGMHTLLCEDPDLVREAARHQVRLFDLRKSPDTLGVNQGRAGRTAVFRIHTVGSDCNCGKKVVALELDRELRRRGYSSRFVATGQSGIAVSGHGIAVDHVMSYYVSGAAEHLVLENAPGVDTLVLEGQGSILHPMYSGVTLGLLHGFMPQALVLCHQPDRTFMRGTSVAVPPLSTVIELYESLCRPLFTGRVVGIALNLMAYDDTDAERLIQEIQDRTGRFTTDVIRHGAGGLLDVISSYRESLDSKHKL